MEKQKKKLRIGLCIWELEIYEIGNTYQIATTSPMKKKDIHILMNKHAYFRLMINLQKGLKIQSEQGITCYGKAFINYRVFEKLREILIEAIEKDISLEEKKLHGIYSSYGKYSNNSSRGFVQKIFYLFKRAA